ncbi:MAG: hypothetical protein E7099_03310 [Mediterranea massiliensis]|nr:hypothetical protein [Mediterranea massiliensis]
MKKLLLIAAVFAFACGSSFLAKADEPVKQSVTTVQEDTITKKCDKQCKKEAQKSTQTTQQPDSTTSIIVTEELIGIGDD